MQIQYPTSREESELGLRPAAQALPNTKVDGDKSYIFEFVQIFWFSSMKIQEKNTCRTSYPHQLLKQIVVKNFQETYIFENDLIYTSRYVQCWTYIILCANNFPKWWFLHITICSILKGHYCMYKRFSCVSSTRIESTSAQCIFFSALQVLDNSLSAQETIEFRENHLASPLLGLVSNHISSAVQRHQEKVPILLCLIYFFANNLFDNPSGARIEKRTLVEPAIRKSF